jgi:hypothetical protein
MTERSPYRLDSVQIEEIVQALQKAAETLRPKPSEERLYRILGICVRVAGAAFAGMVLVLVLAASLMTGWTESTETALTHVFRIVMGLFFRGFVLLFFFAAIGALVFLLLNQSVVRQAFRQQRLLKKLGIREVSLSAWRLQHRGHRWSRLRGTVLTWGGIVSLILGAVGSIGAIMMLWTGIGPKVEGASLVVWIYGLFLAFGVTVLVWRFVQRSREQWAIVADANRLRSMIQSMQAKANAGDAVAIPATVVEHAAQIERVSIGREQRDAVVASAGTTNYGYGILVARDLPSQKGLLDPKQRISSIACS